MRKTYYIIYYNHLFDSRNNGFFTVINTKIIIIMYLPTIRNGYYYNINLSKTLNIIHFLYTHTQIYILYNNIVNKLIYVYDN